MANQDYPWISNSSTGEHIQITFMYNSSNVIRNKAILCAITFQLRFHVNKKGCNMITFAYIKHKVYFSIYISNKMRSNGCGLRYMRISYVFLVSSLQLDSNKNYLVAVCCTALVPKSRLLQIIICKTSNKRAYLR